MHKPIATIVLLALTLVSPAAAGTRNCTAALVTQGLCRVSTDRLLSYDLTPSVASDLVEAVAAGQGCAAASATTCTAVCASWMVAGGACTSADLGAPVTLTKVAFSDAWVRWYFVSLVKQYREDLAVAPARATARSAPDPDISN